MRPIGLGKGEGRDIAAGVIELDKGPLLGNTTVGADVDDVVCEWDAFSCRHTEILVLPPHKF